MKKQIFFPLHEKLSFTSGMTFALIKKKKKKDIVFSDALCFEHLEKDESDFFKGS